MTADQGLLISRIMRADDPHTLRDEILRLGFNGLVFQRWYPDIMDNWEGQIVEGFFELYYGLQLYKVCPVAHAIHHWTRDYTFAEARAEFGAMHPDAYRVEKLYQQFGMADGIVCFTGTNKLRSAVILTTAGPAAPLMEERGGLLALAARRLTDQLVPGHEVLQTISRDDPRLSKLQNRILQMQIDNPELSNQDMARALGMSPKTLHAHHKKIAKKTGVTTFAGAVLRHIKQQR